MAMPPAFSIRRAVSAAIRLSNDTTRRPPKPPASLAPALVELVGSPSGISKFEHKRDTANVPAGSANER